MTQHTPGPWQLAGPTTVSDAHQSIGIANVSTFSVSNDAAAANARLIAAAPDLLKALLGFQRAWDENRLVTSDEAAAIRAAIAKATTRGTHENESI